jgi:hypothetical protein
MFFVFQVIRKNIFYFFFDLVFRHLERMLENQGSAFKTVNKRNVRSPSENSV